MSAPTVVDELDYSILLSEIDAFTASMNVDLAQIILRQVVNAGSAIRKDAAATSFCRVRPAPILYDAGAANRKAQTVSSSPKTPASPCTCSECSKEAA